MKPINIDGRDEVNSYGICPLCTETPLIPIDDDIAPTIFELNAKGYTTVNCCSGHSHGDDFYIQFTNDVHFDLPEFLHYEKYGQYENGQWTESKNCVRGILKEDTMAKLYIWAQELCMNKR
jgi:hypothetical protein